MQQFEIRRGSQVVKKGKTCVFGQNKTRLKRLNENMKPCPNSMFQLVFLLQKKKKKNIY